MFNSHTPYLLLTIASHQDVPSFHLRTFVYRISTKAGKYIINIEEYLYHTYVIKFYPVHFKRYPNRYHMISNDSVIPIVIGSSLQIMITFLQEHDDGSFGFVATESIIGEFRESKSNNQRFRIYKLVMQNFFGHETFAHFTDTTNSAYLMVNKGRKNIPAYISEMQTGFSFLYPDMFNLEFAEV
jgi:hypothetical protein